MNQQITAPGPASTNRIAVWAAFEAAVLAATGVKTPVRPLNKGYWKALAKRKLHLVAVETLPNRNQARVRRLGAEAFELVQVEMHDALITDHWSDYAVTPDHPELAASQEELFKELGRAPRPREISPLDGEMTAEEVVMVVEEFLSSSQLPRDTVTVAGKAALVLHGIVSSARNVELWVSQDHDLPTPTNALVSVITNPKPAGHRPQVAGLHLANHHAILSWKAECGDRTDVIAIRRYLGHRVR